MGCFYFVCYNKIMRISIRTQLIILIVVVFLLSLEITALILYEQGKLGRLFYKASQFTRSDEDLSEREGLTVKDISGKSLDDETLKRIKELEEKINELEKNQKVPFPKDDSSVKLTEEQISAIVQLWCPDNNYNESGFMSLGSGTIVSPEGIIITNRHVVSNQDWSVITALPTCYVAITDDISEVPKIKYAANLVAYAPQSSDYFDFDIAILYINDVCKECAEAPDFLPSSFPYLDLGYSGVLVPGDYMAIAGYPEIGAETFNFTEGVLSGKVGDFVLKTDAKIDSGNSGGAALNNKNQLIGVPTWTISGQAESMGYVIAIDQIFDWYEKNVIPSKTISVPY